MQAIVRLINKEKERIRYLSEKLDDVIGECHSKDDIIALSSLFLVYARKLLAFGASDEQLSDDLIFYYISNKMYTKSGIKNEKL